MENDQSFITLQSNSELEPEEIKIAVIGNTSVGKSALIHRFLYDKFITGSDPTIEENFVSSRVINTILCKLSILDTGDQEKHQKKLDSWIHSSNAFILVYSIDDQSTYDKIIEKHDYIKKAKQNETYSIVIIGNKCDLVAKRKINEIEAQAYCAAIKVPFLEASALDKTNVNEAFLFVSNEYIIKKSRRHLPKRECRDICCIAF